MELVHIANATFSSLRNLIIKFSLENLASKTKHSGLLKSTRQCRRAIRRDRPKRRARIIALGLAGGCGRVVEPAGIEPATFWLQTRRSPS